MSDGEEVENRRTPSRPSAHRLDVKLGERPPLSNLRTLVLHTNTIGTERTRARAAAPFLASLEDLDLSYHAASGFGDAGAAALAASPHLGNLVRLHLNCNRIGPAGLRALLDSPHLAR